MLTEEEKLEQGREIVRLMRDIANLSRQANAQQDESEKSKILGKINAARKSLTDACSGTRSAGY